ncbi:winged helix-turn-helix transcriptional regulator [Streptomyces endophyticus]|uniref:Helix-turn-helix transcriptional regulator n=1 Tax=Streptomyces endophyticus TaxID=714166 RepID=A0ABU6F817_9ACTN|nr:helix-turn-helix domain-containing protein [Streptomyces endophyticus]MEB8340178.1 helix-turn-helix transcriptional regulator [Streptomyces endophyticus]
MEWLETSTENCPVQLTLGVVGEKWTLLILRDAFNGVRRFDDFRRHIGLSEAVLSDRLRKLTAAGILRATPYQQPGSRARNEYRVTRKGWDLWPVLVALKQWGEAHLGDEPSPVLDLRHEGCGAPIRVVAECEQGHTALTPGEAVARPGPGARMRANQPTRDVRGA